MRYCDLICTGYDAQKRWIGNLLDSYAGCGNISR